MGIILPRRAAYRVRQFMQAMIATRLPITKVELAEIRSCLPESAQALFLAMSRADQWHGLSVLHSLRSGGYGDRALMQAALLHDCAKHEAGIRLWHRVAVVLLKAFLPSLLARWVMMPVPPVGNWRYPFWTYTNHPQRGAELATRAGCDPAAAVLIRHHQDPAPARTGDRSLDVLLAALQAADDDN